ncbi:MAG: tetratricopeptide repeat protein, partial [Helicobacteraceae bacterium]|nr:tetratricopeptide repeat protein [Helicobacteraceae bacterium]
MKTAFALIMLTIALSADNVKLIEEAPIVSVEADERAKKALYDGINMLKAGNLKEAEKLISQALEIEPDYIDAIDYLGVVYRRKGEYQKAEKAYARSIDLNATNFVPFVNLALVYRMRNEMDKAIDLYKKVIEFEPENAEPYYGLGEIYFERKDYNQSIASLDAAAEKYKAANSNLVYDAYFMLGLNYYHLKNYGEAL